MKVPRKAPFMPQRGIKHLNFLLLIFYKHIMSHFTIPWKTDQTGSTDFDSDSIPASGITDQLRKSFDRVVFQSIMLA
jgi:hypothetical protein